MNTPDELFTFVEHDKINDTAQENSGPSWRILIADDDADVHDSTVFALRSLTILNRPLAFIHSYSAAETLEVLAKNNDIAVILLDVVMETEDAGLKIVKTIRHTLGLADVRIVLRTGQPGYAPEMEAISHYEINDYKTKNELTRAKLYTSLTAAIRSYDQLQRLDANRDGLRHILNASQTFIAAEGLREFAEGVILQLSSYIGIPPEGLLCTHSMQQKADLSHCEIIGATGRYAHLIDHPLNQLGDADIQGLIKRCLSERRSIVDPQALVLFCPGRSGHDLVTFVDSHSPLNDMDRNLLDLFAATIGLSGENITLISHLRDAATLDALVRLPNRLSFIDSIDQKLQEDDCCELVIALISIDCFAEINNVLDSRYGDLLLQEIARCLCNQLPNSAVVAKVGGACFGLLGPSDIINPSSLHALFDAPLAIDGIESMVSFSMGLVNVRDFQANGAELFHCASIAQKRAKTSGQIGQAAYYTPAIRNEIRDSAKMLHELRVALQNRLSPFYLVYQPQIDLASGRVIGLEALVRWKNRDGGIISPERFIPVAEQSGLIVPLGNWILKTTLADLQRLQQAGFESISMAVNVSPVQFRHPDFLANIDLNLRETGINSDNLELEITESAAIQGMEFMQNILHELKARHISVAIDDFGTGYSSLSYLDRLPVDRLKIDRSFINLIGTNQPGMRITEMVVPLGRHLGMKVLAEGVEGANQITRLRQLGCDEIQGFYMARPMAFDQLLEWLRQPAAPSVFDT